MNCTIIFVTYNGMTWLPKSLESAKDYTIIVVDNNSNDGTIQFIKNNYPKVILLEQTKNLGFGAANNIGISYALNQGTDYVFLLNQDAYLKKGTIEKLIKVYKEHPQFGIISPIHLNGKGDKLDSNFANYIKINNSLLFDAFQNKYTKNIYEVPFVNAAAWLIPRIVLEKIGGFDPIFFHYGEDDNYCQRLKYHGFKIGVVPNVYVNHDREERSISKKEDFKYILTYKERILKYKLANINTNLDTNLFKLKTKLIRTILKSLLKFQVSKVRYSFLELLMVYKKIPEIVKSRQLNEKIGMNYLES